RIDPSEVLWLVLEFRREGVRADQSPVHGVLDAGVLAIVAVPLRAVEPIGPGQDKPVVHLLAVLEVELTRQADVLVTPERLPPQFVVLEPEPSGPALWVDRVIIETIRP